ncbi:MAG: CocE/NonD family hydrolase, partial [Holophagaceae bacterium]
MSVRRWYLIILVTLSLFAQNPVQSTTLVQDRYTKLEQYVTMRDGIRLFTSIYIPKDNSQKHPILLLRTPYSVAPYGLDSYRASVGPSRSFDGEDYIYVYQDVRGRWKSEGIFVDMNPVKLKKGPKDTDETTDTYDTIDWLIKNIPRNNGRVGMWGISWPGHMVAQGMISHHPALKAVSPQAPMIDLWEGDDAYHLGAFQLAANFGFFTRFGGYRPEPISEAPKPILIDNPDGYDFYLKKSNLS